MSGKEGILPGDLRNRILRGIHYDEAERKEFYDKFIEKFLKLQTEDAENFSRSVISLQKPKNKELCKFEQKTNKKISLKKKKELGLYAIGKKSLKYKDLKPLNELWIEYMTKYLNLEEFTENSWTNNPEDPNFDQVSIKLFRADYHGCKMKIIRSSCPSYVGISGIVVMETKNCFKLLGKDNIVRNIPKASCVFTFNIHEFEFMFYGKNFQVRPADRSSKKIKTVYVSDLQL